MTKPKVALIRGQFLNQYDMQSYEPLASKYDFTAFGSLHPFHREFVFPAVLLPSLTDLPEIPKKMPILNRLSVDANYLVGLEEKLRGFAIAHTAETYYHYTHQAILAKRKGNVKKVVTTVWENIPCNNEGIWGRKWFKDIARKETDHFIAVSGLSKNALVTEGVDSEKITVISPGINTRKFFPEKDHFKRISARKKEITILFVGRLEDYKGVFDVLKAAVLLKKEKDLSSYELKYIFAGNGSQKEHMKAFAKKKGLEKSIMYMTAAYASMPEIYTMADIFVAPSKKDTFWQEQYGMMLLEAQAAAMPIVSTKSGAIEENVGDAALLGEEGNVTELAKNMKAFIQSPKLRVSLAEKARRRAETIHDISFSAKKIDEVYREVLKK